MGFRDLNTSSLWMGHCSLARDKDPLVEGSLHLSAYLDFGDTCHVVVLLRWSLSAQYLLTLGEVPLCDPMRPAQGSFQIQKKKLGARRVP